MSNDNGFFQRPNSDNRSNRPTRTGSAVGGKRDKLAVAGEKDPNYHYMFVKNTASQIAEFQGYGYEIDQSDLRISADNVVATGSSKEVVVDRTTGEKNILMRQPIEFHEEDKLARAKMIAESEKDMLRNVTDANEGKYGDVSITRDGT